LRARNLEGRYSGLRETRGESVGRVAAERGRQEYKQRELETCGGEAVVQFLWREFGGRFVVVGPAVEPPTQSISNFLVESSIFGALRHRLRNALVSVRIVVRADASDADVLLHANLRPPWLPDTQR
jgi:hypothetical protein